MSSATAYKVHVKLGQSEFSAEGPEGTVKQQLADFLQLAPAYAGHQNGSGGHTNGRANGHANGNGKNAKPIDTGSVQESSTKWATTIDDALLNRLFVEDKDGLISLRVLPPNTDEEREASALFLILFGLLVLKQQSEVKASDLLVAARQSGVSLKRIDESLEKFDALVTKGGTRRGSRYALTNPGIEHAEYVASKMFG